MVVGGGAGERGVATSSNPLSAERVEPGAAASSIVKSPASPLPQPPALTLPAGSAQCSPVQPDPAPAQPQPSPRLAAAQVQPGPAQSSLCDLNDLALMVDSSQICATLLMSLKAHVLPALLVLEPRVRKGVPLCQPGQEGGNPGPLGPGGHSPLREEGGQVPDSLVAGLVQTQVAALLKQLSLLEEAAKPKQATLGRRRLSYNDGSMYRSTSPARVLHKMYSVGVPGQAEQSRTAGQGPPVLPHTMEVVSVQLLQWASELILADRFHTDTELQAGVYSIVLAVPGVCPMPVVAELDHALRKRTLFNGKLAEQINRLKTAANLLPPSAVCWRPATDSATDAVGATGPKPATASTSPRSLSPQGWPVTRQGADLSAGERVHPGHPSVVKQVLALATMSALHEFAAPPSVTTSTTPTPFAYTPRGVNSILPPSPANPSPRFASMLCCTLSTITANPSHSLGTAPHRSGSWGVEHDLRTCFVHPLHDRLTWHSSVLFSRVAGGGGRQLSGMGGLAHSPPESTAPIQELHHLLQPSCWTIKPPPLPSLSRSTSLNARPPPPSSLSRTMSINAHSHLQQPVLPLQNSAKQQQKIREELQTTCPPLQQPVLPPKNRAEQQQQIREEMQTLNTRPPPQQPVPPPRISIEQQQQIREEMQTLKSDRLSQETQREGREEPLAVTHVRVSLEAQLEVREEPQALTPFTTSLEPQQEVEEQPRALTRLEAQEEEFKEEPQALTPVRTSLETQQEVREELLAVTPLRVSLEAQQETREEAHTLTPVRTSLETQQEVREEAQALTPVTMSLEAQQEVRGGAQALTPVTMSLEAQQKVKEQPQALTPVRTCLEGQQEVREQPQAVTPFTTSLEPQQEGREQPQAVTPFTTSREPQQEVKEQPQALTRLEAQEEELREEPQAETPVKICLGGQQEVREELQTLTPGSDQGSSAILSTPFRASLDKPPLNPCGSHRNSPSPTPSINPHQHQPTHTKLANISTGSPPGPPPGPYDSPVPRGTWNLRRNESFSPMKTCSATQPRPFATLEIAGVRAVGDMSMGPMDLPHIDSSENVHTFPSTTSDTTEGCLPDKHYPIYDLASRPPSLSSPSPPDLPLPSATTLAWPETVAGRPPTSATHSPPTNGSDPMTRAIGTASSSTKSDRIPGSSSRAIGTASSSTEADRVPGSSSRAIGTASSSTEADRVPGSSSRAIGTASSSTEADRVPGSSSRAIGTASSSTEAVRVLGSSSRAIGTASSSTEADRVLGSSSRQQPKASTPPSATKTPRGPKDSFTHPAASTSPGGSTTGADHIPSSSAKLGTWSSSGPGADHTPSSSAKLGTWSSSGPGADHIPSSSAILGTQSSSGPGADHTPSSSAKLGTWSSSGPGADHIPSSSVNLGSHTSLGPGTGPSPSRGAKIGTGGSTRSGAGPSPSRDSKIGTGGSTRSSAGPSQSRDSKIGTGLSPSSNATLGVGARAVGHTKLPKGPPPASATTQSPPSSASKLYTNGNHSP
eukprot:gene2045-18222_t